MSAHYRNHKFLLHYFTHILSSEYTWHKQSMRTHLTHACQFTDTYWHKYTQASKNTKSMHTHIHIPFNPAHHTSPSGQPLMMLKRERRSRKKWRSECEMVWNIASPNEVEVIYLEGRRDGRRDVNSKCNMFLKREICIISGRWLAVEGVEGKENTERGGGKHERSEDEIL